MAESDHMRNAVSVMSSHICGGGTGGGGRPGETGAGVVREAGEEGGGKRDSQGGGKGEKKRKIMQHCAIFCNRKDAKGREPKNTGQEPGLKGTGSGRIKPPCPPPPHLSPPPLVGSCLSMPFQL